LLRGRKSLIYLQPEDLEIISDGPVKKHVVSYLQWFDRECLPALYDWMRGAVNNDDIEYVKRLLPDIYAQQRLALSLYEISNHPA